jgi:glyoxylase-like metal-dependent hydrolase (beta-lactamase superfamily II)
MNFRPVIFLLLIALAPAALAEGIDGTHDLTRIADGIYVAEPKFGGANATIIITDAGVVIVDSQSSPALANALLADIRALTDKPVTHVINSHWHGDHHGGNRAIFAAFGHNVEFIAHKNTREDISALATPELRVMASFYNTFVSRAAEFLETHRGELNEQQVSQVETYIVEEQAFVEAAATYEYFLPTMTLTEDSTLYSGGRELQILYFQEAHTRGDLAVFLPAEKILISGDLLTAPYIVPRSAYPTFEQYVLGHGGPVKSDKSFIFTMAEFLEAAIKHAGNTADLSFEDSLEKAGSNEQLQEFNKRIDWNEPGMRFLDWGRLLQMTLDRAYLEARGELP